jgi:hypothetical protein
MLSTETGCCGAFSIVCSRVGVEENGGGNTRTQFYVGVASSDDQSPEQECICFKPLKPLDTRGNALLETYLLHCFTPVLRNISLTSIYINLRISQVVAESEPSIT